MNANSIDPDQTLHSVPSDPGLQCLQFTLFVISGLKWINVMFFLQTDGSSTVPSEVNFSTDQKTLVILHYNNLHHNGKWTCTASNYLGKSQAYVDVP